MTPIQTVHDTVRRKLAGHRHVDEHHRRSQHRQPFPEVTNDEGAFGIRWRRERASPTPKTLLLFHVNRLDCALAPNTIG
jgi:hypothetical protein